MTNMDTGATDVKHAMEANHRILLYGDYDVDGMSSVMIGRDFFKLESYSRVDIVKYNVRTHHISNDVINDAFTKQSQLVIIMDTGSGLEDKELLLKLTKFTKVIVCDHHAPQYNYDDVPGCTFINPTFFDNFPYLSGACVVYEMFLQYYKMFSPENLNKAKKVLSFLACASLYSDSIYGNNFYTKTLSVQAKNSLIPTSVNFLPYINASKRFYLYSFAPPFNACFRNNRFDLINNLLLNDSAITFADKNRYIKGIESLRSYSREVVQTISSLCLVTHYDNIVFSDLTGLLNQNIPNQVIRDNKGLIANILAEKYKKCAVVVVSDGTKFLISVRDFFGRDIFKFFNPFYKVGGHKPAFGGTLTNKDRLEIDSKLKFFDSRVGEGVKRTIVPFSYQTIESIALENEYNQQMDIKFVRIPFAEFTEEWTPDSFSEKYIQFKLKKMDIYIRKEAWYKQGSDLLAYFYYTTKLKADAVQEVDM